MLSAEELIRYSRHILIPEVGREGQVRLKSAKVLVIGAGGLGCPVLQYLAAAGVGKIGIVDSDTIELSNLQRQVLFTSADCGALKATVAAARLKLLNPTIEVLPIIERFSSANALRILNGWDLIVDGTDNFPSRYLINDACVVSKLPFVTGALSRFSGQLAVCNWMSSTGSGPTYRCIFPEPPAPEDAPSCAEAGVLGVVPGIIGSLQANEVLKALLQPDKVVAGALIIFDALTLKLKRLEVKRDQSIVSNTRMLSDPEYLSFCGVDSMVNIPQILPQDLHQRLTQGEKITLIDVREPDERPIANIGGELIPMNTVLDNLAKIPRSGEVVVYCRSGGRSQKVCELLAKHGYSNIANLRGGMLGWSDEVDPTMTKY